jgi:hypothetical protein
MDRGMGMILAALHDFVPHSPDKFPPCSGEQRRGPPAVRAAFSQRDNGYLTEFRRGDGDLGRLQP